MELTNVKLENLGTVNQNQVDLQYKDKKGIFRNATLFFSYETIVGIETNENGMGTNKW